MIEISMNKKNIRFGIAILILLSCVNPGLSEQNFIEKRNFSLGEKTILSQNGKYIGIVGLDIRLFENEGNLIWKKEIDIKSNPLISVSNNGDVTVFYVNKDSNYEIILINKNGEKIFDNTIFEKLKPYENSMLYLNRIKISPDGKYISLLLKDDTLTLVDRKGNIVWRKQLNGRINSFEYNSIAFFPSGNVVISVVSKTDVRYNFINSFDPKGNEIFSATVPMTVHSMDVSDDGEYVFATGPKNTNVLDKNGKELKIIEKFLGIGFISKTSIFGKILLDDLNSNINGNTYGIYTINGTEILRDNLDDELIDAAYNSNGLYFISDHYLYYYDYVTIESPKNNERISSKNIRFSWKGDENEKYELHIDNETFQVTGTGYTLENEISLGDHKWKVKHIKENGEGGLSEERSFVVIAPDIKVVENIAGNFQNKILIALGLLFLLFVVGYYTLPYYKRAKIKKEMAKTPTDWCPECHKFTGGAAICPHCGQKTFVETKYDTSKKVKKK